MAKGKRRPSRGHAPRAQPRRPSPESAPVQLCEADVAEGLETIATEEITQRLGRRVRFFHPPERPPEPGTLRFSYTGDLAALLELRTVMSLYLVQPFDVPRPKALLGDEQFRAILAQVETVLALHPPGSFELLYLSAAGSESTVMNRIKDDIAARTGLTVASHEGDLLLRVRPARLRDEGWEVMVRISPRPLATRSWRVCDMEGAMNGTVAHAMVRLTEPTQRDTFLNLACGSGTLLAERIAMGPAAWMMGCDINPAALDCARQNLDATGHGGRVELHPWDARAVPLPDQSVDVLCSDLPFGHLVGSHEENLTLYPAIMKEAARLLKPGGPFVLITHEVRLMESLLERNRDWRTILVQMVTLGGLHPRIFLLQRRPG